MNKKRLFYRLLVAATLLLVGCSVNEKYSLASNFYLKNNYVIAIQLYDDFLETQPDGALSIKSKIERSDSYYQLGYKAYKKNNWILASRLFFLANSQNADNYIDNCYFELAKTHYEKNEIEKTLEYYSFITSYLKDSEFIPRVLNNRILIHFDNDEKGKAFSDYHRLWTDFPEHELTKEIQPTIDSFMPEYIDEAIAFKTSGEYDQAIRLLFKLNQYPSELRSKIIDEISTTYLLKADRAIENKKYQNTRVYCDSTLFFSPEKKNLVSTKLNLLCQTIIKSGDQLLEEYKFDLAINKFQKCFLVIPNYQQAEDAISNTNQFKIDYNLSLEFKQQGLALEDKKEYRKALNLYVKSNNHYSTKEVKYKIFIMNNLIRSEKDPKSFAKNIVLDYKNGKLSDKILLLFEENKVIYGADLVSASGWKVSYAAGQYNYEVRYDIISPDENYYFAWRVNLKTRKISPSNKISEKLMSE